jgi:hypothetical protein
LLAYIYKLLDHTHPSRIIFSYLTKMIMCVNVSIFVFNLSSLVLPPSMYYILMVYNPIVLVISRGTQIYKNYKTKQTGAQSSVTISMNLLGSLVRMGTTIKEIGFDFYILRSYGTSVLLNSILLGQIILYSDKYGGVLDKKTLNNKKKE